MNDVTIVGGGPAGLAAAVELKRLGVARVLVVDREAELGGIPRHCHHTGFGFFDLRKILSGPDYAKERASLAADAHAEIATETTVTGFRDATTLETTSPRGLLVQRSRAILLATGCRERPRAARLVPGSRPAGIFTTGSLQQWVCMRGQRAGRRAIVVGAEHVSYSAVHTLTTSGTEVVAIVTDLRAHQTLPLFAWLAAGRLGVPLLTRTRIVQIVGKKRVEGVVVEDIDGNATETLPCDTIVFTGDWIPDHELARKGGLVIDEGTRGPRVDAALRSSVPGVFAAGNLLRGAEMADVAALEGRFAARSIRDYLGDGRWPEADVAPIVVEAPLAWICPNAAGGALPPRSRFVLQAREFLDDVALEVRQEGNVLHTERYRRLVPNRPFYLSANWTERARRDAGAITVRVASS